MFMSNDVILSYKRHNGFVYTIRTSSSSFDVFIMLF